MLIKVDLLYYGVCIERIKKLRVKWVFHFFFKNLIFDILLSCGLEKQMKYENGSITSFKPTILIFAHCDIPKGVIQFKSPCQEFSEN